eukprot:m.8109 g.8109  ORF g.8109 m.8109 type:complete len:413 (-) comp3136_c0_seq1:281-1519(-)
MPEIEFVGVVPIHDDEGCPPDTTDCRRAISFLRRSWRATSRYRHGVPSNVVLRVEDYKGMIRLWARTFPPREFRKWEFVHPANRAVAVLQVKHDVAFIVHNDGATPNQTDETSHMCYVFTCAKKEKATEIAQSVQACVTKNALETLTRGKKMPGGKGGKGLAQQPAGQLNSEQAAAPAELDRHDTIYDNFGNGGALVEQPIQPLAAGQEPNWWRGRLTKQESRATFCTGTVRAGDFYIRKSRTSEMSYTLSMVTQQEQGLAVEHFHINQKAGKFVLETNKEHMFDTINDLVAYFYDHPVSKNQCLQRVAFDPKSRNKSVKKVKLDSKATRQMDTLLRKLKTQGRLQSAAQIETMLADVELSGLEGESSDDKPTPVKENEPPRRQSFAQWEEKKDLEDAEILVGSQAVGDMDA